MTNARPKIMSDDRFQALFTPEGVECFVPSPDAGGCIPKIEVWYLDTTGEESIAMMVLNLPQWEEQGGRFAIMRTLGATWAREDWRVYALRLASEAWIMQPGPDGRGDHTTRQEHLIVMGATIDGRQGIALAPMQRDLAGDYMGLGPWRCHVTLDGRETTSMQSPLLEEAWTSYVRSMSRPEDGSRT